MKKCLLLVLSFVVVGTLQASDSSSTLAKIIHDLLINKKMTAAISSLNEIMAEIKDKHIRHLRSEFVRSYYSGNTRYTETAHYYDGRGDVVAVVDRYEKALKNLNNSNMLMAAGDGAILGVLVSIIGKMFKWDNKTTAISIAVSSAILALAKNKQVGKVPYLTFPKLVSSDNYFCALTTLGTFACIAWVGAMSYFGTDFLIDSVSDKVSAINEAMNASNP